MTQPLDQLTAWAEKAEACSPGPWQIICDYRVFDVGLNHVATTAHSEKTRTTQALRDAECIALSRTAMPVLCQLMRKAVEMADLIKRENEHGPILTFSAIAQARAFLAEVERELGGEK